MKFTIIIDTIKIRKFFVSKWFIILLSFIMLSSTVFALNVAITTFSSGNPALASDVNANFNALKSIFNTSASYIPYDDGSKLSNSNIYYNSNYIGIDTTVPNSTLHIEKSIEANKVEFIVGNYPYTTDNNKVGLWIDTYSSGDIYFDSKLYANGKFHFRTGQGTEFCDAREWMTVDAKTGNIGLGTTSPSSKLQVVDLPEYSDNATAISGGLTAGAFYRTGDLLKVVH